MSARWLAGVFAMMVAAMAAAHPLAPMLLELRQIDGERYAVEWRVSSLQVSTSQPLPVLPASCRQLEPARIGRESGSALVARWQVECEGAAAGLVGERIAVSGMRMGGSNAVVRVITPQGRVSQSLLDAQAPEYLVPARPGTAQMMGRFGLLGMQHLLGGWDHLAFLVALVMLVRRGRPLVIAVTAFTVGHSLTLALAALGLIPTGEALMELTIALSVVLMARAVLLEEHSRWRRYPAALAAAFGLLHGLGFAGAMTGLNVDRADLLTSLLAFNIGIELGQLVVVAAFLLVARMVRAPRWREFAIPVTAHAIGAVAVYWCLERGIPVWRSLVML